MYDPDRTVQKSTVLVVDDDRGTADTFAAALTDEYDVRTAYSGAEALEQISFEVDVVLLDRRMPEMSGDDVLTEIKRDGFACRIVMVTAVKPGREILDLPFDDYLTKPVSAPQIQDAVERMLIRKTCDEQIRNLVAIASKMATLEAKMTIEELEVSTVYADLEAQFEELKSELDMTELDNSVYSEFTTEKIRALFS
jgi:CheY-like chemotaxis protein